MDEEDDDFYAPNEGSFSQDPPTEPTRSPHRTETSTEHAAAEVVKGEEDLEEGEEEEEVVEEQESDSDIDIITDHKDASSHEPPPQSSKNNNVKPISTRTATADTTLKGPKPQTPAIKTEASGKETPPKHGSDYPAIATSTIDVNANPMFEPAGKTITEVDMDHDFSESEKPWRIPRSDLTDWFNYGFDEFTWSAYCFKQNSLFETNQKGPLGDVMSGPVAPMPGFAGIPVPPGGSQAPIGTQPIPGFPDIPQEEAAFMSSLMARGVDISQMKPEDFFQQMQQMRGGAQGNGQLAANQASGFMGGGNGYAQPGQSQQQINYGIDASGMAGGDGRNRLGNFAPRGRGVGRRW